jgi:molybdopterin adenylyltransferase
MRRISRHFVPTAILSRQTAVIRRSALIINLSIKKMSYQNIGTN